MLHLSEQINVFPAEQVLDDGGVEERVDAVGEEVEGEADEEDGDADLEAYRGQVLRGKKRPTVKMPHKCMKK